ncbi:hypothetical protein D3C71_1197600 [compost metagenome]
MLINANTHSSREMSAAEEKAWLHFFSGDPMFRDFVNNQARAGEDPFARVNSQPICLKCERPGFFHMQGMACNHCGYVGPIQVTANAYLKEGWWK